MAEATPSPRRPEGDIEPRPFDRRALEATLADAVRTAEAGNRVEGPDPATGTASPATSTSTVNHATTPAAAPAATGGAPRGEARVVRPRRAPAQAPDKTTATDKTTAQAKAPTRPGRTNAGRALNPFAAPAAGSGMAPRPRPISPTSPTSSAPKRQPPSLLGTSGNGLASAGTGLNGLGRPSPGNLTPINFSGGDSRGPDAGGTLTAGPAPTEAEKPTITLRRGPPATPTASAKSSEGPPQPATAPAQGTRTLVPIAAWMPSDDDILPSGPVRRSFRLAR